VHWEFDVEPSGIKGRTQAVLPPGIRLEGACAKMYRVQDCRTFQFLALSNTAHRRRFAASCTKLRSANLLELLSAKRLQFCAAGLTKIAKQVDRPAIHHLPQLREGLVRRQIRIDNYSGDLVGPFDDLW
jgi:hypothetical protein